MSRTHFKLSICGLAFVFLTVGCKNKNSNQNGSCNAAPLDIAKLTAIKYPAAVTATPTKPAAFIVDPNPIDATGNVNATENSQQTWNTVRGSSLPGLLNPNRLQSSFFNVFINNTSNPVSSLAKPDSQGRYLFALSDPNYSQTAVYSRMAKLSAYFDALGFQYDRTRPFNALAKIEITNPNEGNALYDHKLASPNQPRNLSVYGAPAADGTVLDHEYGHSILYRLNPFVAPMGETGGDGEADSFHEERADKVSASMSFARKFQGAGIGRWLARSLTGFAPGEALRYLVDPPGQALRIVDQMTLGGNNIPTRYGVAEALSRATWEIYGVFLNEDATNGEFNADRLLYAVMSTVKEDPTIKDIRDAYITADAQMHCGAHANAIFTAFERRGVPRTYPNLTQRLNVQVGAQAYDTNGSPVTFGASTVFVVFNVTVSNPNNELARSVRAYLETTDLVPYTPGQGWGNIRPQATLVVNANNNLDSTLIAIPFTSSQVIHPKYKIHITVDNGQTATASGTL